MYQSTNLSTENAGITFGSLGWRDYIVELRLRVLEIPNTYSNIGIGFRQAANNGHSYTFYFSPSGHATLTDTNGDVILEERNIAFPLNKWNTYQIKVQGNTLTIYIDGKEVMSSIDTTYPYYTGNIVVWGDAGSQFQVDDIKVTSIP